MIYKKKRNKAVHYRYADIHIFKMNVDKRSTNVKVRRYRYILVPGMFRVSKMLIIWNLKII